MLSLEIPKEFCAEPSARAGARRVLGVWELSIPQPLQPVNNIHINWLLRKGGAMQGGRETAGRIIYLKGARGTHGPALCLHTQGLLFLSHNHLKNKDV